MAAVVDQLLGSLAGQAGGLVLVEAHQMKRRIVVSWLIYTANVVGYWGMTVFLTTFMVQKFHGSAASAISYALLMYLA